MSHLNQENFLSHGMYVHVCMYVQLCVCTHVLCMFSYICKYVCMYICACTCVCTKVRTMVAKQLSKFRQQKLTNTQSLLMFLSMLLLLP